MFVPSNGKLLQDAIAMELLDAKDAGALGFIARALIIATMPHKKVIGNKFERTNGNYTLMMTCPEGEELPSGVLPRRLMALICSLAYLNKNREIILGNISDCMRQLDMSMTGGKYGAITALKKQLNQLFNASIFFTIKTHEVNKERELKMRVNLISKTMTVWDKKNPEDERQWQSKITLTEEFYQEILSGPVPIDLRAITALKNSSLAIDIYCWLTWRMYSLKRVTLIRWEPLMAQFGSDFSRPFDFKKHFNIQMQKVLSIWPLIISEEKEGLLLHPNPPHVPIYIQDTLIHN